MILEFLKSRLNKGLLPNLYFWRDRTGHEIDLVGEWGGLIHAIEIKAGATFQKILLRTWSTFVIFRRILKVILSMGEQEGSFSNIEFFPFYKLDQVLTQF